MTRNLPNFSSYGNYSSSNYGAHSLCFSAGDLTVWFSYKTPIAFRKGYGETRVSENCWGPTTGKHLNWIDDGNKKARLPREQFERELAEAQS